MLGGSRPGGSLASASCSWLRVGWRWAARSQSSESQRLRTPTVRSHPAELGQLRVERDTASGSARGAELHRVVGRALHEQGAIRLRCSSGQAAAALLVW